MIRHLLSIAILFSLFQPLFSQTSKIKWGPEYDRDNAIIDFLTADESHFYAISGSPEKNQFLLLKFSLAGKFISEKAITLPNANDLWFKGVFHTANHDYVIFLNRDKKQDKASFYYAEVKNGVLTPLTKSFHTFPFAYTFGSGLGPAVAYDEEATSGSFRLSPDKKTFVTFGSDIGHSADQIIEVVVFNENMEQIWKKTQTVEVPNRQMEVVELVVNNSGEVFVIVKQWAKLNDRYMGDKPLEYTLYAFNSKGVKEYKLKLDQNREPVALSLQIGKGGEVAVMGTYRDIDTKPDYTTGTFFAHFDASGKLVAKTFPYSKELLTALNHTSTETKNNALSIVAIKDLGVLPNGNFYFAAAKYTYITTNSGANSATTTIGQMLVTFTPNGESVQIDYLLQPFYVKNLFDPDNIFTYQKDNGVVFVSNYVKLPLDDSGFKKAPIYTSVCYLEPGKKGTCTDINSSPDGDMLIYPRYQLELKDGKYIVMRASGYYGKLFSFGIY